MEIAPLDIFKCNYKNAPTNYKAYDLNQYIIGKIQDKSKKYPKTLKKDLYLLIYSTHFGFILSDTTIAMLQFLCNENKFVFKQIYYYFPLDENEGQVRFIYPYPKEYLKNFDFDKHKDVEVFNFDPEAFKIEINK